MNGKRYRKILLIVLGNGLLAGCASLDGADPIIPVNQSVRIAASYSIDDAITNFRSTDATKRNNMTPLRYRDLVIAVYLNAIDARYFEFRHRLSGEGRGGTIGADIGIIGLTTAASLIEKSATDLSAVAAAVAGSKGSVDKNLYFDRTLPAILASMDAERAKVRTQIVSNMKLNEIEYPLEVAFGNLAAYELSASIDRAIDSITADASAARKIETIALDKVVKTCAKPADLTDGRQKIAGLVTKLVTAADLTSLQELAGLVGANDKLSPALEQGNSIREKLRSGPCTTSELDELVQSIKLTSWGATI